jgi:hypothetical protein
MVARWSEGFETHQQNNQWDRKYASRTGTFGIQSGRVFGSAASIAGGVFITPSFGLADTWGVAFGLFINTQTTAVNSGSQGLYFDRGGSEQVHLEIVSNSGSFELRLMRGATQLGITSEAFPYAAWHHFELKVTVHPSTGAYELRHNEVNVLSGSGANTANTGSSQADVFSMRFTTTSSNVRFDDIYVWDGTGSVVNDFVGDCVIEGIEVSANGSTNQWTPSAGSNFQNVDDPGNANPVDSGSGGYNGSDTAAQVDLYNFGDLTQIDGTILSVHLDTQLAMASAGSRNVKTKYRDPDTTVVDVATHAVTLTAYASFHDALSTNPNTASAWDAADIDDGQFGVEIA